MNNFIVAVGLPGSGKSTYAEMLRHQKHRRIVPIEIVSSDAIREEVFGDVNDQKHNGEVFNIMFQRSCNALKAGKDVFYDATNLSAKRRMTLIQQIKDIKDIPKISFQCVIFAVPFEECLHRNNERERVVPEYAMLRMYKSFEPPHQSEGWDLISIWGCDGTGFESMNKIVQEAIELSHDNPHHSLSVGQHMLEAEKYVNKKILSTNSNVRIAVKYHDIGKPFCKVFKDTKGNPSEIAHFYNHENVGAYIYLSHCDRENFSMDDIEIANLIAHHMDFFKGEAYLEKIFKRFGECFFSSLYIVHLCDENAH